ncbi:MAG: nuoL [Candidatus Eremiobacteraeota bacterium]|nr:nuoL [Candidatus Eremiobacteraeota bacterium]
MSVPWLPALPLVFVDDRVSRWATLAVAAVAANLAIYAAGDPELRTGRRRFWTVYALFAIVAIAFAHASGLFTSYVLWEAMSVCSFFLIAQRLDGDVAGAAVRALTSTRLGDLLLLAGAGAVAAGHPQIGLAGALVGAAIKSGQLGATPWLVGAMVAPTPVSALLHSATLVAAGPYLLVRLAPQLAVFPNLLAALALYAVISALAGALFAATSNDAKRTLAWSTSEQLAQATLATAAGAPSAGLAVLAGHAFAKPLLFIAAGYLRAATGSTRYDAASRWGRRVLSMVAVAVVGAIALVGIPPFLSSWALASTWSGVATTYPPLAIAAFPISALSGWYATRFVLLLFPDVERPFARDALRPPMHAAAWLGIVLVLAVSIGAFRFRVDMQSLTLPVLALGGGALAVAARRTSLLAAGPAFPDRIVWWDRTFGAPIRTAGALLDRCDRALLAATDVLAASTLQTGRRAATLDDRLDRDAGELGAGLAAAGRRAAALVVGDVSRYVAYTAIGLVIAAIIAAALAMARGFA